ncbi:MAG: hypothetical protein GC191_10350 [Azospirillum sp.]|nr:hypothetical protein [Azospirillum sp.]
MTGVVILKAALGLVVGLGVGVAFFRALRLNVGLFLGSGPVWRPAVLTMLRIGLATAALGGLTLLGPAPALAGLAGFTLVRLVVAREPRPDGAR